MSLTHIGTNFRRFFHGTLPPLALVVISILPLLFGGLFVWSYEDPLGNLDKLPVALVNSDEGAEEPDGSPLNAGEEVTDKLLESQELDFHLVSAREAREGIADGTYYLGVEIPTNFSDATTSVNTDNPHSATLNVTLSNTNGFIPTILGNQAARVMSSVISETISDTISRQLFIGFNTIGEGMDEASEGAGQLSDGATDASDGAHKAREGATQLDEGLTEADSGAHELADGAARLDSGVAELSSGAATLNEGLGAASTGAETLASGMDQLQSGTDQLGSGASQVASGVDQIATVADKLAAAQHVLADVADKATALGLDTTQLQPLTDTTLVEQVGALQAGAHEIANQLNDPTAQYRSGVDTATNGSHELAQALAMLHDGSGQLVAGTATLKDGTSTLVVGANTLADGTSKLSAGSQQLVVGLAALDEGLVTLDAGSGELSMAITDGAKEVPRYEGERLDKAAEAAANPVALKQQGDSLTTFGTGLAPFFLSLSMWFGAIVMFFVLKPMSRRAVDSGVSPLRAALSTYLPAMIIGLVQATAVWAVDVFLIDLSIVHPMRLLAALWFVSMVFVGLVMTISNVFGPTIGRVLSIALMSLQLVASNGLYPPEVQPGFIQWVHSWDPMRFSVDLLRHCIVGALPGDNRAGHAIVVLACIGLGSLVVACIANYTRRVIAYKDLHPELSI
ncbi:YhgE/Pip domain-containing protein [Corynebacterium pilosum]|uniref:Membrane protein n=1 Tax=Corynebacterium pilosum TaxID=35756 RepID=A0A376CNJ2_9CORY|nr:YhgE/Pip domain-containing protein [Corynebacterium pilosum]STC69228.1 membrane protein [Corynebacterium pilosum]